MSKQPVAASLTSISLEAVDERQPTQPRENPPDMPSAITGTKALTLRVNPMLHEELRQKAFKKRRTIHSLILEALRKDGFEYAVPD